ncbi:hypothetical protein MRB53_000286 [Persea americana]|uniref:Uncharacterized protein n=1 Tax=Persea americana TaxID=3435 RepID=A0ACC2MPF0_PERAE|nr:hypothetical protein MRB53_000286 [Persea americana]
MDLLQQLQAIGGVLALLFLYKVCLRFAWSKTEKSKRVEAPEVAGGWPVIGHLHLLRGHEPIHQKLGALADKYGPAFTLRLGLRRTLVVSSWEVVKDCFTTNDKVLASHPNSAMAKYMCYDYAMFGMAPYGPYWRDMRKITTLHLLSNARLDALEHVRAEVVDAHIKELYGPWVENSRRPVMVEIKQWFHKVTFDLIVRMVVGKQFFGAIGPHKEREERRFQKAIDQFFQLAVAFVISDVLPFLNWIDFQGHKSAMKRVAKELDSIMEVYLKEHRRKRLSGEAGDQQDFMDMMLSIMEDSQFSSYDPDTIIKSTSLSLILGGTDTTALTLTIALSFLLNNPGTLTKAQEELDIHVGKDRIVDESDIKNLVYLQAIIKETLRLGPTTTLPLHQASEDCRIGGFFVPSGTCVLVITRKLHMDPCVWSDPCEFRPERFLTSHKNVDVRGQQFEYVPFGSGRRSCSGISFAVQVMHLTLARLLHGFEIASPSNVPIDIERFSVGNPKPTTVDVLITPRLPPQLY